MDVDLQLLSDSRLREEVMKLRTAIAYHKSINMDVRDSDSALYRLLPLVASQTLPRPAGAKFYDESPPEEMVRLIRLAFEAYKEVGVEIAVGHPLASKPALDTFRAAYKMLPAAARAFAAELLSMRQDTKPSAPQTTTNNETIFASQNNVVSAATV